MLFLAASCRAPHCEMKAEYTSCTAQTIRPSPHLPGLTLFVQAASATTTQPSTSTALTTAATPTKATATYTTATHATTTNPATTHATTTNATTSHVRPFAQHLHLCDYLQPLPSLPIQVLCSTTALLDITTSMHKSAASAKLVL
jgi:hypothetical protein